MKEINERKILEEIEQFKNVTNIRDLPDIYHYWSNKYLRPKTESLGFSDFKELCTQYIERFVRIISKECNILSIGAGNCDFEINLAIQLREKGVNRFNFTCVDINESMLERGEKLSIENGLNRSFNFLNIDMNRWKFDKTYQIIIANHSLHHIVELESLFDQIYSNLDDYGYFIVNDMIGRNGHMRWPEALNYIHAFWSLLDDRHKYNHQLKRLESLYENWDCSKVGFEGIRAQDILPLLIKRFNFELFLAFANLISIFIDRAFGHNYNRDNEWDRFFIDFVAKLDDYFIESGEIKPTQMIAVITKTQRVPIRVYKHLTPEFCLRIPT